MVARAGALSLRAVHPDDRHTTIDEHRCARGEARSAGGEIEHRSGDLVGRGDALERAEAFDESFRLGCIGDGAAHRRVGAARQDRIGADAIGAELGGDDLHEPDEPGLARRVGRHAGEADRVADEGRGEDERAAATVVIDARNGLGQLVGEKVMALAIERARKHGSGVVAVRHGLHFGVARRYCSWLQPTRARSASP
jgi:hypothetical protein